MSKEKARVSSSNMVSVFTRETEEGIVSVTSSRKEESAFAADVGTPSKSKIRSDKQYLKQYSEPIASSSHPVEETTSSTQNNSWTNNRSFAISKLFKKAMRDH